MNAQLLPDPGICPRKVKARNFWREHFEQMLVLKPFALRT